MLVPCFSASPHQPPLHIKETNVPTEEGANKREQDADSIWKERLCPKVCLNDVFYKKTDMLKTFYNMLK